MLAILNSLLFVESGVGRSKGRLLTCVGIGCTLVQVLEFMY